MRTAQAPEIGSSRNPTRKSERANLLTVSNEEATAFERLLDRHRAELMLQSRLASRDQTPLVCAHLRQGRLRRLLRPKNESSAPYSYPHRVLPWRHPHALK